MLPFMASHHSGRKPDLVKMCTVMVSLMLSLAEVQAQTGTWTKFGDMPTDRYAHTVNELNGKIYVAGGGDFEGGTFPGTAWVNDRLSGGWSQIPLLNGVRRNCHSSCVVDGKLYVVGGNDGVRTIASMDMFDPNTGAWTPKMSMPTDRGLAACAAIDDKIIVLGGVRGPLSSLDMAGLDVVEVYDTKSDTWTQLADMPSRRWGPSAIVANGKIYVFGGRSSSVPPYGSIEVYDPQTNTWTTNPKSMPTPRYCLTTCLLDSNIYAIGGWYHSSTGPIYDKVECYNFYRDEWKTESPLPVARAVLASLVLGGKIYVYGGAKTTHPNFGTSAIYQFEPNTFQAYAHSVNLSRFGRDTMGVTARVENPFAHAVNVVGILTTGSGVPIDNVLLKDDGAHGDGISADGLWGHLYVPKKDDTINVAIRVDDLTLGVSFTVPNTATYVFTRGAYISLDARTVYLGDIHHTLTRFDTAFQVSNVGWSPDSIYVLLDPVITPESAISVSPTAFALPAGASQTVTFSVMPKSLSSGIVYNAVVMLDSRFGFGQTHFEKTFAFGTTAVGEEPSLPSAFALHQNYPNPFNPTTKIQFTVVNRQLTIVKVYDMLGREVATLVNEVKDPGTYTVQFDASGSSSGVYIYRLTAGDFTNTKRLVLLK